MKMTLNFILGGFVCIALMAGASDLQAKERTFRQVAVQFPSGAKMWLPATIVVNKGDKVNLELRSEIGKETGKVTEHGYSIPAYSVTKVVKEAVTKVSFKAKKAGVFDINCHLHKAHIGGQLIVLDN